MTSNELDRIEQVLGVALPDWYRSCLIEYPFQTSDSALFDDVEEIIRVNHRFRRDGWFWFPWPPEFFVIGDLEGDPYFMLPLSDDQRIFFASHECGPEPVAEPAKKPKARGKKA